MGGSSAEINDEGEEQEANDCDELDAREHEFGFTIYGYGEDVQRDNEYDYQSDPRRRVDVISSLPELYNDRGCRYLRAECEGARVPVLLLYQTIIITSLKAHDLHSNPRQTP